MSFRRRMLLFSLVLVWLPLVVLGWLVRQETVSRLSDVYTLRVDALAEVIREDVAATEGRIRSRLAAVGRELSDDNRLRTLLAQNAGQDRAYLLNRAGGVMSLAGLSMFQIQDAEGKVLSSGHFRNAFGTDRKAQVEGLIRSGGFGLTRAEEPQGTFSVWAGVDSVTIAGARLYLVGGERVDEQSLRRLTRGDDVLVVLDLPGMSITSATGTSSDAWPGDDGAYRVTTLTFPAVDPAKAQPEAAHLQIGYDLAPLRALRRSLDLWLGGILLATILGSLGLAAWIAGRVSRPLVSLAEKTRDLDLDRLDADFAAGGEDEVGVLSTFLGEMTNRLRRSAQDLKEAERRATLGDLARQVNHDLKNGLAPLRNVFRHLSEVADSEPGQLPTVYGERARVVSSSLDYLDDLARSYARASRKPDRKPLVVDDLVVEVARGFSGLPGVNLRQSLEAGSARILGDGLALRRVLENLLRNACDSLPPGGGEVRVRTVAGASGVRISVEDTGEGMTDEVRERIFEGFYTTKESGTGLGLAIVRRVVTDHEGELRVESEPGRGTAFHMEFPLLVEAGKKRRAQP